MDPLYNYIRGVNLLDLRRVPADEIPARNALLATLLEISFPDLKIAPRTLYKVHPGTSRPLSHPNFSIFHPFFKTFFARLARQRPPCAESPHRTLAPLKNRGISRQNRPSVSRRRPKITRKTPLRSPEKPTLHAPLHKKVE